MTPPNPKAIRDFYMSLLEHPNLKDSIFHQAHCEEMVALCNTAERLGTALIEACDSEGSHLGQKPAYDEAAAMLKRSSDGDERG